MRPTLLLLALASTSQVRAQTEVTQLVSADPNGAPGNGLSSGVSLSTGGRYVAFSSNASNLVPGDLNQWVDVFVRDRQTGITRRASVDSQGNEQHADGFLHPQQQDISTPCVSADGSIVAFASLAPDLVPGDTNGKFDVFVHDFASGATTRVSVSSAGQQGSGSSGVRAQTICASICIDAAYGRDMIDMSPDGRFVVFASEAPNLVWNDFNGASDVFLRDRVNGTTELVSVFAQGIQNGASFVPSVSADGRFVTFENNENVYVRDRLLATTTIVSVASDGTAGNGASGSYWHLPTGSEGGGYPVIVRSKISSDGRIIAFGSLATNFAPGDANGQGDVFVHDRLTGETKLVSVGVLGGSASAGSALGGLSGDGRFVAFMSGATDLDPIDADPRSDLFIRDLVLEETHLASFDSAGMPQPGQVGDADVADDGHQVVFMVVTGTTYPGNWDVYARGAPRDSFAPGCDGTWGFCPCGNSGEHGAGCANSVDASGARLHPDGVASVSDDTLALVVSGMPATTTVVFAQGTASVTPFAYGDGVQCLGGGLVRIATRQASSGTVLFGTSADPRVSVLGQIPASGGTRFYQAFYRNIAAFCSSSTFNATNSIGVEWSQ